MCAMYPSGYAKECFPLQTQHRGEVLTFALDNYLTLGISSPSMGFPPPRQVTLEAALKSRQKGRKEEKKTPPRTYSTRLCPRKATNAAPPPPRWRA